MELKEYISKLKDLEISCYEQSLYIQRLKDICTQIVNPRLYGKRSAKQTDKESSWDYVTCIPNGALLGLIVAIIYWLKVEDGGFHFSFVLVGAGVGLILYILLKMRKNSDQKHLNELARKENEIISQKNQDILNSVPRRSCLVKSQIAKAQEKYAETYHLLQQYYSKGIVFEKYRSLVPICMFYEYLQSGRCSDLTGHEGAYNIYENEIRMNIILGKLDDIIERLDRIESNQYILARAIRETNAEVNKLSGIVQNQSSILEDINENASLAAYYNKISAINTTYMAWIKKYN